MDCRFCSMEREQTGRRRFYRPVHEQLGVSVFGVHPVVQLLGATPATSPRPADKYREHDTIGLWILYLIYYETELISYLQNTMTPTYGGFCNNTRTGSCTKAFIGYGHQDILTSCAKKAACNYAVFKYGECAPREGATHRVGAMRKADGTSQGSGNINQTPVVGLSIAKALFLSSK
ncbi:hypothetical protein BCR43DRAFT_264613 [Syncephalastrum racemosum]|uniref:Uncharacterized protein n=1 Tax=Syncephalastrum racemosum TaxID=13706 RepID=A0A1X2HH24_SYNRA|nr:hypothetical protein BCR43DRAFT_264613 [Syncephalastrum racemosum]